MKDMLNVIMNRKNNNINVCFDNEEFSLIEALLNGENVYHCKRVINDIKSKLVEARKINCMLRYRIVDSCYSCKFSESRDYESKYNFTIRKRFCKICNMFVEATGKCDNYMGDCDESNE